MDFEILKNSDVRYGLGVSSGYAIGSVFIYGKPFFKISLRKITDENIQKEIDRFHLALSKAKEDILKIAHWIKPAPRYFLQNFRSEKTIKPEFEKTKPYPQEYLLEIQKAISPFFDVCQVR